MFEDKNYGNDYSWDMTGARKAFDEMYSKGYNPNGLFSSPSTLSDIEYQARRTAGGGYLQPDAFEEIQRYQYSWAEENAAYERREREEKRREAEERFYEQQLEQERQLQEERERIEEELRQAEIEEELRELEEEAERRREERELYIASTILSKHGIDIDELEDKEKYFFVGFYNHQKNYDKEALYVLRRLLNLAEEDDFTVVYPLALYQAYLIARDNKKEVGEMFDDADIYNYLAMNPLHWDKEVKKFVRKTRINLGNGASISNDFFTNRPYDDTDTLNCVYENIKKGVKKTVCKIASGKDNNFVTAGKARVSAIVPVAITMLLTFISTFEFLNKYSFVAALIAGLISFLCYRKVYAWNTDAKAPCYEDEREPYIIGQQSDEYKQYIAYAAIANTKFSRFMDNVFKAYEDGLAAGEKEYTSYVEKKATAIESQKKEYLSLYKAFNKKIARQDIKDILLSAGTVIIFSVIISLLIKTLF